MKRTQIICFILVLVILFYLQLEYFSICEPFSLDKIDPVKLKEADDFIFYELDKVEKEIKREEWQQFERKIFITVFVIYMIGVVLTVCSSPK